MRQLSRAFTMTEVIVVIAIIALISSIVYIGAGPSREKGRQVRCIQQLRQMYVAISAYSNDNQGPDAVPGLNGIKPYMPPVLAGYGAHRDIQYCPNLSDKFKEKLGSSYTHRLMSLFGAAGASRDSLLADLNEFGSATQIVACTIHDQSYYQPRERNIDARFMPPFTIALHLDGSVSSKRRPGEPRSKSLTLIDLMEK